jgi:hypothetical protein
MGLVPVIDLAPAGERPEYRPVHSGRHPESKFRSAATLTMAGSGA